MLFFFCFSNYILCILNFIEILVIFMIRLRNSVFKPFQSTICKSRINRIFGYGEYKAPIRSSLWTGGLCVVP